jgi:hypothetical protein
MISDMTETYQRITRYEVSVFPDEMLSDPGSAMDADTWSVLVEHRGFGRWAVTRSVRRCLGADGEWDYEPSPSGREDDWLETHRFDLETALRLAAEQAPLVTVNGMTALDILAKHQPTGAS